MPAWVIIAIVIGCLLIIAVVALAGSRGLGLVTTRHQFGVEYDRLASRVGARRANAELLQRRRRVARLTIAPLTPELRARYARQWATVQERFVEAPPHALAAAAALVASLIKERGYPTGDREQLAADLSVNHARRLDGYRRAEQTVAQASTATTEDLRQAMLWYRAIFRDLAGGKDARGPARLARAARVALGRRRRGERPERQEVTRT